MRSKIIAFSIPLLTAGIHAHAATLVEDFTTTEHCDFAASTGICNPFAAHARAGVFADAAPTRPLNFGDGSDGIVETSGGYSFNTDAKPVYQFRSLKITGGSISITGKNPLVIRSLGVVVITPSLNAAGGNGQNGSTGTPGTATAGGIAVAGGGWGGAGGRVLGGPTSEAGSPGLMPDGITTDVIATGGPGDAGPAGSSGQQSGSSLAVADFDTVSPFYAGGGGGGGSRSTTIQASAGAGGAGGGIIRITALGAVQVGAINVSGGNGGSNAGTNPDCSGYGAPGLGGAAWLQSLTSVSAPEPVALDGSVATVCTLPGYAPLDGAARADFPGGGTPPAGWVSPYSYGYDVTNALASQTYTIQSKPYDLRTLNAIFTAAPTVTSVDNGGTIAVVYSGSANGVTYTADTSDITTLSNLNIRYVRWKIDMTTAAAPGASPIVSRIEIPYTEKGVADLDLSLGFGCGSTKRIDPAGSAGGVDSSFPLITEFLLLLSTLWALAASSRTKAVRPEAVSS